MAGDDRAAREGQQRRLEALQRLDVQVVGDDTVLFPGDTAIVVADRDQVPHVRTVFKNL